MFIKWKRSNENVKSVLSHCSHIYVYWYWSSCRPKRNPILENQLTGSSLYWNNAETLRGTWFNSLFSLYFHKLTITGEILICRYVDAYVLGYSYKNVCQTYAVNSHERVHAGAFPCKFAAFCVCVCVCVCVCLFLPP